MLTESPILTEAVGCVGIITLNRPQEQLNALSDALSDALMEALGAARLRCRRGHRRDRDHRQHQGLCRRGRHRHDGRMELHGRLPQRLHHARLEDDPTRAQAGDRGRGGRGRRWRLRTGAGLRHRGRGRQREVRAARDQARAAAWCRAAHSASRARSARPRRWTCDCPPACSTRPRPTATGSSRASCRPNACATRPLALAATIASFSLPALMAIKESVNRAFESSLTEGISFERRQLHARSRATTRTRAATPSSISASPPSGTAEDLC